MGATNHNPLEFTFGSWAFLCLAAVVILLIPSVIVAVLMVKRQQHLRSIAKQVTGPWVSSDREPPKHFAVGQLQLNDHLKDCYRKTQDELESLGFKFLWDFTVSDSKPLQKFTRVLLSQDNTVVASYVYEKNESADTAMQPYRLTVSLGSWLMDGRLVITMNLLDALPFVPVPHVDRVDYPADMPIRQMVEKHLERLNKLIEAGNTTPFNVQTTEDFKRGRLAYWELCTQHHFHKRTCEKILTQNLAKMLANPDPEINIREMQAVTRACCRELHRYY